MAFPFHNPHLPALRLREPAASSLAESAPEQSPAWFETGPLPARPLFDSVPHPGSILRADRVATRPANSNSTCSPTNSPPPGSSPICPTHRSTAGPPPPNVSLAWENRCHPQSTPPPDRGSPCWEAHTAAPRPASPHRSRARRRPSDAMTGAFDEHCREPSAPPLARHSCALRAITNLCSSSSGEYVDRRAPRRWPGPRYMPRSASVGGLAKRGVIPRKQFYIKLFFFNTVILGHRPGDFFLRPQTAPFGHGSVALLVGGRGGVGFVDANSTHE